MPNFIEGPAPALGVTTDSTTEISALQGLRHWSTFSALGTEAGRQPDGTALFTQPRFGAENLVQNTAPNSQRPDIVDNYRGGALLQSEALNFDAGIQDFLTLLPATAIPATSFSIFMVCDYDTEANFAMAAVDQSGGSSLVFRAEDSNLPRLYEISSGSNVQRTITFQNAGAGALNAHSMFALHVDIPTATATVKKNLNAPVTASTSPFVLFAGANFSRFEIGGTVLNNRHFDGRIAEFMIFSEVNIFTQDRVPADPAQGKIIDRLVQYEADTYGGFIA